MITFPYKYLEKNLSPDMQVLKNKLGLCKHWNCKRRKRHGKRDCYTCKSRKNRLRNPVHYAWRMIKNCAAKRNIQFSLSIQDLENFDKQTGYLTTKAKWGTSIDRIDPTKGYSADNIRLLDWLANVSHLYENERIIND